MAASSILYGTGVWDLIIVPFVEFYSNAYCSFSNKLYKNNGVTLIGKKLNNGLKNNGKFWLKTKAYFSMIYCDISALGNVGDHNHLFVISSNELSVTLQ